MLSKENLIQFSRLRQTTIDNIAREYCQHLFLSYLYQHTGSEKLLFKGGTALRIVCQSPRFSEDLDFTGNNITVAKVEALFTDTLSTIEKSGIIVELIEGKITSGGYLGIAAFSVYDLSINIQIEVSLRKQHKKIVGERALVINDYLPVFTLVHLPLPLLIEGKLSALCDRQKPRDFYDLFFLLSGNFPAARETKMLQKTLVLLKNSKLDFQRELKKFLPVSQARQLRDFKNVLYRKIKSYLN